jgi:hypothetical protein
MVGPRYLVQVIFQDITLEQTFIGGQPAMDGQI